MNMLFFFVFSPSIGRERYRRRRMSGDGALKTKENLDEEDSSDWAFRGFR
jgi:hypothetical protein